MDDLEFLAAVATFLAILAWASYALGRRRGRAQGKDEAIRQIRMRRHG